MHGRSHELGREVEVESLEGDSLSGRGAGRAPAPAARAVDCARARSSTRSRKASFLRPAVTRCSTCARPMCSSSSRCSPPRPPFPTSRRSSGTDCVASSPASASESGTNESTIRGTNVVRTCRSEVARPRCGRRRRRDRPRRVRCSTTTTSGPTSTTASSPARARGPSRRAPAAALGRALRGCTRAGPRLRGRDRGRSGDGLVGCGVQHVAHGGARHPGGPRDVSTRGSGVRVRLDVVMGRVYSADTCQH